MTYQEAVSYLNETPRFTEKHSLSHTRRLLQRLGRPEESFHIIHVAGSNGKGSVCSYLDQVLRCAGIRTGLFTSPHLVTTRERMKVDGEMISKEDFLDAFLQVKRLTEKEPLEEHPTYFEYLFLMCMLYFKKQGVETAVLETGLGGRLDATNAPLDPDLCIITSISLEHTEYLGDTIPQIAGEKAGIIKEGVPVVYDDTVPEASRVICARAEELHAPAYPVGKEAARHLRRHPGGIDFSFGVKYDELSLSLPALGLYQVVNASLAVQGALLYLGGGEEAKEAIRSGIHSAKWPGRMEEKEPGVVLDGAHNPSGIRAFLESASALCDGKKAILLFSALKDKKLGEMVPPLASSPIWEKIYVTGISSPRAAAPEELAEMAEKYASVPVECIADPLKALEAAKGSRKEGEYLFCSGSLYLVGELEKLYD